jgi:hypothetical protein
MNNELIDFATWITSEDCPYSILYGSQEHRFADEDREYTVEEMIEIFRNRN